MLVQAVSQSTITSVTSPAWFLRHTVSL